MNTREGTIGTATPRPTRHTHALPTAAGRRQWKGTIPTEGPSRNRRGTAADMRQHTATHTRRESHTGHPLMGRRHGTPGTASSHRSPRRWASSQQLRDRPETATTRGKPSLPGRAPSHNPTTRHRATHSADACQSGAPTRVAPSCPAYAAGTQQMRASLGGPTTRDVEHEH